MQVNRRDTPTSENGQTIMTDTFSIVEKIQDGLQNGKVTSRVCVQIPRGLRVVYILFIKDVKTGINGETIAIEGGLQVANCPISPRKGLIRNFT